MRMVEKVAQALCKASGGHWRTPPFNDLHTESLNNHWRFKARAALAAMREPDDEMRSVFIEADWNDWPAESAFVVAIDKAIQESVE